jgi:hypothetical protein
MAPRPTAISVLDAAFHKSRRLSSGRGPRIGRLIHDDGDDTEASGGRRLEEKWSVSSLPLCLVTELSSREEDVGVCVDTAADTGECAAKDSMTGTRSRTRTVRKTIVKSCFCFVIWIVVLTRMSSVVKSGIESSVKLAGLFLSRRLLSVSCEYEYEQTYCRSSKQENLNLNSQDCVQDWARLDGSIGKSEFRMMMMTFRMIQTDDDDRRRKEVRRKFPADPFTVALAVSTYPRY